jgi:hypothetical protein
MTRNTVCSSREPITVQAGLPVRKRAPVILMKMWVIAPSTNSNFDLYLQTWLAQY